MSEPSAVERITLTPRMRHRAVGDEGVIVHLDLGRVTVVNEVGLHILKLLKQPMPRPDLVSAIVREFEVDAEQAEADLTLFLDELAAENLLVTAEA